MAVSFWAGASRRGGGRGPPQRTDRTGATDVPGTGKGKGRGSPRSPTRTGTGRCLAVRAGVPATAAAAALLREAVRAVDRLVAARLERHARLVAAGRTGRGVHLALAAAVAAAATAAARVAT